MPRPRPREAVVVVEDRSVVAVAVEEVEEEAVPDVEEDSEAAVEAQVRRITAQQSHNERTNSKSRIHCLVLIFIRLWKAIWWGNSAIFATQYLTLVFRS